MKNHPFNKYIYMGLTAISVITAAILIVFLFLEREAVGAAFDKVVSILAPIIYGAVLPFSWRLSIMCAENGRTRT